MLSLDVLPRRWGRKRGLALAAGVLVLGVAASGVSAGSLAGSDQAQVTERMDRRLDRVRTAVADETQRYVDTMSHLSAAVGSSRT